MTELIEELKSLSIESVPAALPAVPENILYWKYSFSAEEEKEIIDLVLNKTGTVDTFDPAKNTVSRDGNTYTLNAEFHTTVLYTGGKPHDKACTLTDHVGKTVPITICKIGITDKFICAGVSIGGDIPYYGTEHQHITIGLNKGGKKVSAADSFTALLADNAITLDEPLTVQGTFGAHMK
jgi:hypothetical protein